MYRNKSAAKVVLESLFLDKKSFKMNLFLKKEKYSMKSVCTIKKVLVGDLILFLRKEKMLIIST